MANIGDILNSPEQGWRRVLFSDFDSINFIIHTKNYKDFIVQDGVHVYEYYTSFIFSNSPYTTKWRLIGSTIKEEVNLLYLPPDATHQVNRITPDSEHRLLMEGFFASEDDYYRGKNFFATVEYSTDFVLYAVDFYDGLVTDISTPKVVEGTPNEGMNGTLGNGLLVHYSFNDGSLADISGNGYDLTQVGIINNTTDKDGKTNQAKENTSSSYLTSSPKSITGGTDNAISMWMYIPDLSYGGGVFFSISDSPLKIESPISIRQYYATIVVYASGESSSYIGITKGWHNIVYNKNKLYIDKQLTTIHKPFIINSFLHLSTGYQRYAPGKLDEIRVYDRALTGDATTVGEIASGEIAEIFDIGVNYANKDNTYKISEIKFNIDFDKTQLGTSIDVKYSDIKASGGSILYKNPVVKYWTNYDKTVRVFDKEVKLFENSTDLYFQIECDGYETSDVIHKELKMIHIDGYHGDYNGGVVGYANHTNDNYKTTEARILIPLTNTSFISYKK